MKLPVLHTKLINAARAAAPHDHVPYAFEKRVTALIKSRVASQHLDSWVHGLWRAALSCVAIAALCGAWAFFLPASSSSTNDDISQNFENTLLASVDQGDATP
jgi:hypothetical protein